MAVQRHMKCHPVAGFPRRTDQLGAWGWRLLDDLRSEPSLHRGRSRNLSRFLLLLAAAAGSRPALESEKMIPKRMKTASLFSGGHNSGGAFQFVDCLV